MKKVLINLVRFLISFGVMGGLVYLIGLDRIIQNLRGVDTGLLGVAILIFLAIVALMAVRWNILLRSQRHSPGYFKLLIFYFIGYFFNNFLPTAIGGDVSRAYYAAKSNGNTPASIGSVLFERILGVISTLTLATLSMFWFISGLNPYLCTITVLMLLGGGLAIFTLLNPALFNLISSQLAKITVLQLGERINKVLGAIHLYRFTKHTVLYGYLVSLSTQLLLVLMNFALARSLGLLEVTIPQLLLVLPVSFVLGMLPSINGIGVRESGYVLFLARIFQSTTADQAIALSLLNTTVPILISLIGGVLLVFYRHKPRPESFRDATPSS